MNGGDFTEEQKQYNALEENRLRASVVEDQNSEQDNDTGGYLNSYNEDASGDKNEDTDQESGGEGVDPAKAALEKGKEMAEDRMEDMASSVSMSLADFGLISLPFVLIWIPLRIVRTFVIKNSALLNLVFAKYNLGYPLVRALVIMIVTLATVSLIIFIIYIVIQFFEDPTGFFKEFGFNL